MPDEVRVKILEPFFTTKDLTGTAFACGLALAFSATTMRKCRSAAEKVRITGEPFMLAFPVDHTATLPGG